MENLRPFRDDYTKQGYRIVGQNSAAKVCLWTRKSLLGKGECYKSKFYGVPSWRCLQMTPSLFQCTQRCVFCWRKVEATLDLRKKIPADDSSEIIEGCIAAQRELLSGFKGNPATDMRKWREAQKPTNAAISLAGEPILYERLGELIEEFHRRAFTTFLVTNGTLPEKIKTLRTEPTQLYVTLAAPDEFTYKEICRPQLADSWNRLNESLELMPSFGCIKVIRLTLVKGLNLKNPARYAKLIKKASPDFIEAKAYMHVGFARSRLSLENMPSHEEVRNFSMELASETGYEIADESGASRVVLLK